MSLIYALGVAIVAQIFMYSGLIFMAGKLLPNLLTPVYHLVPTPSNRLLFSSLTVMLIGNCFFQYLYSLQPILIAGIRKRRWVDYRTKNAEYFNGHRSHSARHRGGYLRICSVAGSESWGVRIESSFRGRGQLLPSASALTSVASAK